MSNRLPYPTYRPPFGTHRNCPDAPAPSYGGVGPSYGGVWGQKPYGFEGPRAVWSVWVLALKLFVSRLQVSTVPRRCVRSLSSALPPLPPDGRTGGDGLPPPTRRPTEVEGPKLAYQFGTPVQ